LTRFRRVFIWGFVISWLWPIGPLWAREGWGFFRCQFKVDGGQVEIYTHPALYSFETPANLKPGDSPEALVDNVLALGEAFKTRLSPQAERFAAHVKATYSEVCTNVVSDGPWANEAAALNGLKVSQSTSRAMSKVLGTKLTMEFTSFQPH